MYTYIYIYIHAYIYNKDLAPRRPNPPGPVQLPWLCSMWDRSLQDDHRSS